MIDELGHCTVGVAVGDGLPGGGVIVGEFVGIGALASVGVFVCGGTFVGVGVMVGVQVRVGIGVLVGVAEGVIVGGVPCHTISHIEEELYQGGKRSRRLI